MKQNIPENIEHRVQAISTTPSRELNSRLVDLAERMTDRRYPLTLTRERLLSGMGPETVRQAISALRAAQRGPTKQEWASHYAMLALNFPLGAASPEQASLKFQTFCADLSGIPAQSIAAACKRYRLEPSPDGKQKFFPQSWQIIAMCDGAKRFAGNILVACDEMELVLDRPEENTAPGVVTFDISKRIRELGSINRNGAVPAPCGRSPVSSAPKTSRPCTDAAELRASLARKGAYIR